jgi:hypothetical protein
MVKKCYVVWPDTGQYSGPYEVDAVDDDIVTIDIEDEFIALPKDLTIGVDDGWTVWEGGECPVSPISIVEVTFRSGATGDGPYWGWHHTGNHDDIIAYRVVEEPKPEQVPLSTIMDRKLWWEDEGMWYAVDRYEPDDDVDTYHLTDGTWVSRGWFIGREHRPGEEFDD